MRGWFPNLRKMLVPVEWLGIGLAVAVLPLLPHRLLLALCDLGSGVLCGCDRKGRRRALFNLRIITGRVPPEADVADFDPEKADYDPTPRETLVIRRSYRNMSRTVGHLIWTCWRARSRTAAVGELSDGAKSFLEENRPAVTVSGHLGCWEILSQLAYLAGHRMMSVAKDIGTPAMTELLMRSRRSIGQEIVPADGAFKKLLQGIRGGCSLGLLVDQHVDPKDGGVWVRFLGRPMPVSAAPAFFAAKAKAPVVVAWSHPLKDGRYRCESLATYAPEEARDIWRLTQRCLADLERVIRRHPSCWVLNYNYFCNRPTENDLRQLAEREGKAFAPREPRTVTYFVRAGGERNFSIRLAADLRAQSGRHPLDVTAVIPDTPDGQRIVEACQNFAGLIPDMTFRSVTHADPPLRVAVLIPAYNVERYLGTCLDSILAQSMPVDIFCCDDGSTDGTGRILDDYAARFPRVHALHHPNRGMSATYNRLLDELPPGYDAFGIVDSDDYVHPEMYATLSAALQREDADVAECGIVAAAAGDVPPAGFAADETTELPRTIGDMSAYWVRRTAPSGWISKWNKLYRRSACGSFRFRVGLDYEDDFFFATEVNAAISRKVIVPQKYYAYRRNPNSLNGRVNFRKYLSSAALRLRLSCETFLAAGRVPKRLEAEWRRDWAKDAYRMLIRKNLRKNPDAALRRKLFRTAGERLADLMRDFGVGLDGLNPVQRLICRCCLRDRYALAWLLVALT